MADEVTSGNVRIHSGLLARLSKLAASKAAGSSKKEVHSSGCDGWLVGRDLFVASCLCRGETVNDATDAAADEHSLVATVLPHGIHVIGGFGILLSHSTESDKSEAAMRCARACADFVGNGAGASAGDGADGGGVLVAIISPNTNQGAADESQWSTSLYRTISASDPHVTLVPSGGDAGFVECDFVGESSTVLLRCELHIPNALGHTSIGAVKRFLHSPQCQFLLPNGRIAGCCSTSTGGAQEQWTVATGLLEPRKIATVAMADDSNNSAANAGGGAAKQEGERRKGKAKKGKKGKGKGKKGKGKKGKGKKSKGGGGGGDQNSFPWMDDTEDATTEQPVDLHEANAAAEEELLQEMGLGMVANVILLLDMDDDAMDTAPETSIKEDGPSPPRALFADVLCYVDRTSSLSLALDALRNACGAQLDRLLLAASTSSSSTASGEPCPATFHFDLRKFGFPHAVSASYALSTAELAIGVTPLLETQTGGADGAADTTDAAAPVTAAWKVAEEEEGRADLCATRQRLHIVLGLPQDRPLLRTCCALSRFGASSSDDHSSSSSSKGKSSRKLRNVHEGIPDPILEGAGGGEVSLVKGDYLYYHYLQDNINDKGWGCAYRSLQTISSWFKHNHYTRRDAPTHAEIQRTLVSIGDKPHSFQGSRQWIGSQEVGFVLSELLGVTSRYIMVNSGHDLEDKGRELMHHFDTQGTPVMMGGGALAFTLLGVKYNKSSGAIRFLILDPHYTGGEDLKTIQTKSVRLEGYKATPCGWRDVKSFSKSSFYSLCLPQRPMGV